MLFAVLSIAAQAHNPARTPVAKTSYYFLENKGQWDSQILFRADIPQGQLFITRKGISYKLMSDIPASAPDSSVGHHGPHGSARTSMKGHLINVSFEGARQDARIGYAQPEKASFSFIKGKSGWVNNARGYREVRLENLYDGIDLKLYFKDNLLKYDFVVKPGKDPSRIILKYEGADSLYLEDGHLVIGTSIGKIYEKPPFSYQKLHGKIMPVSSVFRLKGNMLSFGITGKYYSHEPLIIDPELIFSTYSGSLADNFGNTATYDDDGNMYTGGIVFGDAELPTTPGPLNSFSGIPLDEKGPHDAFIMKYSPDGKQLLQAVYLGGANSEYPISMIVNKAKELVILGVTGSSDFPVTAGSFDNSFNGGSFIDIFYNFRGTSLERDTLSQALEFGADIFIAKLKTSDFSLISSTFLGGQENDGLQLSKTPCVKNYGDQLRGEIMTDKEDNIYIASHTYSPSINGIANSGSSNSNKGSQDALVVKLSPNLSSVIWSHMLGGSGFDSGLGIRIDSLQNVYVTGGTTSNNLFGSQATGFQKDYSGGIDGYIAKLSSNGDIVASTFLGTSAYDQSYFIDLDRDLNVYVTGQTQGQYPVFPDVYNNPNSGQFLHELSNNLDISIMSTVYGSGSGSPDISLTAFMVNDCKKIFISGWGGAVNEVEGRALFKRDGQWFWTPYVTGYVGGNTTGMPVTSDALQSTSSGSGFYFIIFHPGARTLAYATHFGGLDASSREHVDGGTSRFDKKGVIYQSVCAGCGGQNNFPTPIPGVWSMTNRSENCNNASLKFDLGKVLARVETFDSLQQIPSVYGCVPLTFLLKNKSSGATNYKWDIGTGTLIEKNDSLFVKFSQRGKQNITLIAFDTTICRLTDTARAVINAGDVRVDFAPDTTICPEAPYKPGIKLYTPWAKVRWSPGLGVSDTTSPNPVLNLGRDMTYYITVNDDSGCVKKDTLHIKVKEQVDAVFPPDREICISTSFQPEVKLTTPSSKVKWSPATGVSDPDSPDPVITANDTMKYVITVTDDSLCPNYDTLNVYARNRYPKADFKVLDENKEVEKYSFCYPAKGYFRNTSREYDYSNWYEEEVFLADIDSFPYDFPRPGKIVYKLVVFDTLCKRNDEISKIVTLSRPEATFPQDMKVCPDSVISLEVTGDAGYQYTWSPAAFFDDSTRQKQTFKVTKSGSVFISVKDSIGCELKDTVSFDLFTLPDPIAENRYKICYSKAGGVDVMAVQLKSYHWHPGESTSNLHYVTMPGLYYLTGRTMDGCPVKDSVKVIEKCDPELHVPDAFTPNGDGQNDFFTVFGKEVERFDIKIFNRWGELIYQSNDFRFRWDGTFKNETVPIGTYPYIITWGGSTFEGDQVSERLTGDITVVR